MQYDTKSVLIYKISIWCICIGGGSGGGGGGDDDDDDDLSLRNKRKPMPRALSRRFTISIDVISP